ncbi:MAG: phosphatase [Atopobiaceae bacterium]|nr:phosphatase [Atopobiaceae bacterium]
MVRVAVIDVGTVTARLAIAEVEAGKVQRMMRQSTIVNLGEGVDRTGRLSDEACGRLLGCVDAYLSTIREVGVRQTCCTLTSAARDASNSGELLAAFEARELRAQVIPGKVEGTLTFLGVAQDFPGELILVADNGGGSTEFALGSLGADERLDVRHVRSIDVGCRRVTERFLLNDDPPKAEDVRAAHKFVESEFAPIASWLEPEENRPQRLVVTGGTSTTLVALTKELVPYDSSQVHLAELTVAQVRAQEERLAAVPVAERAAFAGIQPQRAPVMLGGAIAVSGILSATGFSKLTVSESDLLFGLSITAAAAANGEPSPVGWRPELGAFR